MSDSMIGQKIGQYTITKFIANGGMADVYQAHDEGLDRDVALKILFPQYSRDTEFTERFQREARAAASLRHPNIIQVYATGITEEGDHYIAMEFVADGTLEEVNTRLGKDGSLIDTGLVLKMMRDIADALAEAHKSGIVHRDLKPSNILVRKNHRPVLSDLGIALSGSGPRLTQTNKMMGTPDYMSPEQAQGVDLDGRSDIYAFGIMLYELLCGRRPFGNESPWMVIHKQINEEAKPLEHIRPGLDPQVYDIVRRCMAKSPDGRYQTAKDLTAALDSALMSHDPASDSSSASGTWKTMTLDTAGVLPPTGGTEVLPRAGSSGFALPTHSNPNLRPESAGLGRWVWLALAAVVLTISGLIGWLVTSIDRGPVRVEAPLAEATDIVEASETPAEEIAAAEPEPSATFTLIPTEAQVEVAIEKEEEEEAEAIATTQVVTQVIVVVTDTPLPPTATAVPTDTPPATATPTAEPTATVNAVGNGLPIRFENGDGWAIEGNAVGGLVTTDEQAFAGEFSGKIDYAFSSDEDETLSLVQVNPISGRPNTIGVRLYGDGSGQAVFALVLDATQQSWLIPLGAINHADRWAFMSGRLDTSNPIPLNGAGDGVLDFPLEFRAIQISDINDDANGSGTIYIDELSSFFVDANASGATETPENATGEAETTATPAAASGRNVTIMIAPGGRCDDGPHGFSHEKTLAFKWTSNIGPADLRDGERFVLTISGGSPPTFGGLSFDQSFSGTPGEWLVFVEPGTLNVNKSGDYEWRIELRNAEDQVLGSSVGKGCFST